MEKIKSILAKIKLFFTTTKLGHTIKSMFITFTGIFVGILTINPLINELAHTSLPTIQQLKDIWPVVVDALYRAAWAFIMLEIGIYKYQSSETEKNKNNVIPTKVE